MRFSTAIEWHQYVPVRFINRVTLIKKAHYIVFIHQHHFHRKAAKDAEDAEDAEAQRIL